MTARDKLSTCSVSLSPHDLLTTFTFSLRRHPVLCLLGSLPLPAAQLRLLQGHGNVQDGQSDPFLRLRLFLLPLLHPQPSPLQRHERQVQAGLQVRHDLLLTEGGQQPRPQVHHLPHLHHQPDHLQLPSPEGLAGQQTEQSRQPHQ